jgi:hypothetical protein
MNGYFGMLRGGVDYFMDNRNTLTLSGTFNKGEFTPVDDITTGVIRLTPVRQPFTKTFIHREKFPEQRIRLSFKHLFPKAGNELTADVNYNRNTSEYLGLYDTKNFDGGGNFLDDVHQEMHWYKRKPVYDYSVGLCETC